MYYMNKLIKAMFCVTFFSIATRALGFLLKIYLSRRMSPELLGSYQVAMSVFGVLMTFVSSGIPVVLSRNISYYYGQKNKKAIGSTVSSALIITTIICTIVSIFILGFPNLLNNIFTSTASTEMLKILLPGLVFSSIYEVLRGALWGQKKFFAISFTEFIEQVARIIIIVLLFETTFCSLSLTNKTALSLSLACIISSIIVVFIYIKEGGNLASPKTEFKGLLKQSSLITTIRTISSAFSSIIAIIIPIKLMDYGYSSTEALAEYGIMMGMTFPLLMIPSTLIGSLAVTTIPSISEQSNNIDDGKLKDVTILKNKITFILKITVIFATILLPVFLSLGVPICKFVFKNEKAGIYLTFASISMLPLGISQITTSVLNAIGLEVKTLKNYTISALFLIASILILPKYIGTYSLIVGYLLMSTVSSLLNIKMLRKRHILDLKFVNVIFIMLGLSIFSSIIGKLVANLFKNLFLSIAVSGTIVFLTMSILIYALNIADLKVIIMKKGIKTKDSKSKNKQLKASSTKTKI